jgi:hypothetical protein
VLSGHANNRQSWDADDIEKLHLWLANGVELPEIARRLGRTQEAVRKKGYALDRLQPA